MLGRTGTLLVVVGQGKVEVSPHYSAYIVADKLR